MEEIKNTRSIFRKNKRQKTAKHANSPHTIIYAADEDTVDDQFDDLHFPSVTSARDGVIGHGHVTKIEIERVV